MFLWGHWDITLDLFLEFAFFREKTKRMHPHPSRWILRRWGALLRAADLAFLFQRKFNKTSWKGMTTFTLISITRWAAFPTFFPISIAFDFLKKMIQSGNGFSYTQPPLQDQRWTKISWKKFTMHFHENFLPSKLFSKNFKANYTSFCECEYQWADPEFLGKQTHGISSLIFSGTSEVWHEAEVTDQGTSFGEFKTFVLYTKDGLLFNNSFFVFFNILTTIGLGFLREKNSWREPVFEPSRFPLWTSV